MTMSEIGLLTFHRTTNFGSYLQTFGLFKKIEDLGFNCEIIDYRCPAIEKRENLQNKHGHDIKSLMKRILLQPALDKKAASLVSFSAKHMKSRMLQRQASQKITEQFFTLTHVLHLSQLQFCL